MSVIYQYCEEGTVSSEKLQLIVIRTTHQHPGLKYPESARQWRVQMQSEECKKDWTCPVDKWAADTLYCLWKFQNGKERFLKGKCITWKYKKGAAFSRIYIKQLHSVTSGAILALEWNNTKMRAPVSLDYTWSVFSLAFLTNASPIFWALCEFFCCHVTFSEDFWAKRTIIFQLS